MAHFEALKVDLNCDLASSNEEIEETFSIIKLSFFFGIWILFNRNLLKIKFIVDTLERYQAVTNTFQLHHGNKRKSLKINK